MLSAFGLLLCAAGAGAHPLLQNHFWAVLAPDVVRLRIGVTPREVATAGGLEPAFGGRYDARALAEALPGYGGYLREHIRVAAQDRQLDCRVVRWRLEPASTQRSPPPTDLVFAQVDMECPTAWLGGPPEVTFEQDVLRGYSYSPGQMWDVSYVLRIKYVDAPGIESVPLRSGRPFAYATRWSGGQPLPPAGRWPLFLDYVHAGVRHILQAWDHLLFVAALVLGARRLRSLVAVVAAFTVAHSLTLALSATGLVQLDPAIVEPVIAASIVAAALQNLFALTQGERWRLAVAFGLGLFHGLGFAGGLLDAMRGLPPADLGVSILGFSAGVEIAHLVVVLPLVALLRLGEHVVPSGFDRLALRYGSVAISLCGLYYLGTAVALNPAPWEGLVR
jgi:hydrogenase/urease accessory protein HupE